MSTETASRAVAQFGDVAAIMPVRVFGYVRDQTPLRDWAAGRGISVITDSAASFGTTTVDCKRSMPPVIEVFSLHATKSFGIGEGGAIFANKRLEGSIKSALNFGLRPDRSFGFGLNGKMSEFQAAVGLGIADKIDGMSARRTRMCETYDAMCRDYVDIKSGIERGKTPNTNYPVLLPVRVSASEVCEHALEHGVQLRRYYFPSLSTVDMPGVRKPHSTEVSDDLAQRMVCLPVYSDATELEIDEIVRTIRAAFKHAGVR